MPREPHAIIHDLAGLLINVKCFCPSSFCIGLQPSRDRSERVCPRATMAKLVSELRTTIKAQPAPKSYLDHPFPGANRVAYSATNIEAEVSFAEGKLER